MHQLLRESLFRFLLVKQGSDLMIILSMSRRLKSIWFWNYCHWMSLQWTNLSSWVFHILSCYSINKFESVWALSNLATHLKPLLPQHCLRSIILWFLLYRRTSIWTNHLIEVFLRLHGCISLIRTLIYCSFISLFKHTLFRWDKLWLIHFKDWSLVWILSLSIPIHIHNINFLFWSFRFFIKLAQV